MANQCETCNTSVYRTIYNVGRKQWLGVECGCTRRAREPISTVNPFSLVLDHVHDEFGNKLRVENMQQLSRAEQRLGFQSVVLNKDAQNFDDAPQQPKIDVAGLHNWKFSNREQYERNRARR